MNKKLSDLILMSDVDGTLLPHNETIPQRNIDALKRFTDHGGRFGLATGRSLNFTKEIASQLPVNFPSVVFNGGMLYDFQRREALSECFLPEIAKKYLKHIMRRYNKLHVMVVDKDEYHDVSIEQQFNRVSAGTVRRPVHKSNIEAVQEHKWYKVLLIAEESEIESFDQYLSGLDVPGVRFVHTNKLMIEMLPAHCSKGSALLELMKLNSFEAENLVAIGDFHNDIEMIQLAGLGVSMEGAPCEVRQAADLLVGPCEKGALADLIEYLECKYL